MNDIHDLPYWKEQREQREAERQERMQQELIEAWPRLTELDKSRLLWLAVRGNVWRFTWETARHYAWELCRRLGLV